jgi:hypothetical protein
VSCRSLSGVMTLNSVLMLIARLPYSSLPRS